MSPAICVQAKFWELYESDKKKYKLWRSCKYDPTPGEPAPPNVGNLPPDLTLWIFVNSDEENPIGKISILVDRDRWNYITKLNNPAKADEQLQQAASSAAKGKWEGEPLAKMIKQGYEEIKRQIVNHETSGSRIFGDFVLY